jgi:outer membrane protein assembly factor BamB
VASDDGLFVLDPGCAILIIQSIMKKLKVTTALILGIVWYGNALAVEVGEVIWEFDLGDGFIGGVESSIGLDGTVYAGGYMLDGATGEKKGELEPSHFPGGIVSWAFVQIASDGTLLYKGSGSVYALDGNTREKKWEFGDIWEAGSSHLAIGVNDMVYVNGGFTFYALDGTSGEKVWEFEIEDYTTEGGSSPTVGVDGTVYFTGTNTLYALNGATGGKKWEKEFIGSALYGSPSTGEDGTVYLVAENLHALDGATGEEKWAFDGGNDSMDGSSPTIGADGTLYYASGALYALDGATGEKKWEYGGTDSETSSVPVIGSDSTVYVASDKLYALDGATGTKKWEWEADNFGWDLLIGADGIIYVEAGGKFYAIQGSSGPAESGWPMYKRNAQRTGRALSTDDTTTTHIISVLTTVGGIVTGGGDLEEGKSTTLTATATSGYLFANWSGDVTSSGNPLTLTATSDLTITANFIQDTADDDADGLTNYEELVNYRTDKTKADTDGDGLDDKAELDAGGDPKTSNAAYIEAVLKQYLGTGLQDTTNDYTPYTDGWFYNPLRGWMWTKKDVFPYFFDTSGNNWMYFKSGSDTPLFWDFDTETWVSLGE